MYGNLVASEKHVLLNEEERGPRISSVLDISTIESLLLFRYVQHIAHEQKELAA